MWRRSWTCHSFRGGALAHSAEFQHGRDLDRSQRPPGLDRTPANEDGKIVISRDLAMRVVAHGTAGLHLLEILIVVDA